jgi:hypothetical protein
MTSNKVAITGNTYPVKDQLKLLGAKWDGLKKAWLVDASRAEEAQALVAGAGPAKPRTGGGPPPTICKQCQVAASRYNRIYRSGICSQCYRDDREEAAMGY